MPMIQNDVVNQSDNFSEMPHSEVDSNVWVSQSRYSCCVVYVKKVIPTVGVTSSRWDVFIHLLRQESSRPKKEVLDTIAERYCNGIDAAASSSDRAVAFYNLIKNLPSTSTKVILQHKLNLHINGHASMKTPNILTAIDETEEQFIIKILRTDHSIPYNIQRVEEKQEQETCILLGLNKPPVALCPVEVISISHEDRNYIALKMPRFLCTLQDSPKTFHHTIVSQGRRLIEAIHYMHDRDIVHMDIKADNIFIGADKMWVLADFGSSKHIRYPITTSNLTNFVRYKLELAETKLDWLMLLLVLVKEPLEDRSNWISVICDKDEKYDSTAIDLYIRGLTTNSPLQMLLLELQELVSTFIAFDQHHLILLVSDFFHEIIINNKFLLLQLK